jgi:hypothetical protein
MMNLVELCKTHAVMPDTLRQHATAVMGPHHDVFSSFVHSLYVKSSLVVMAAVLRAADSDFHPTAVIVSSFMQC